MARDIACTLDGVTRSTWMIGNLETGEQTPLCDACLVVWMLGKLDADLAAEGKRHVAARWGEDAGEQLGQEGSGQEAPKSAPGAPGRRRRPRRDPERAQAAQEAAAAVSADQDGTSAEGVAPAPATPDDG